MVTMPVLQFVFLLVALVILTGWLALKFFLVTCAESAVGLKTVLAYVWKHNPDTLGLAMGMIPAEPGLSILCRKISRMATADTVVNPYLGRLDWANCLKMLQNPRPAQAHHRCGPPAESACAASQDAPTCAFPRSRGK